MASTSDHALGQRLTQLIQQSGDSAFEAGALNRRLQSQLQDLLGADTSLLNPLRDLLQRPGFRQLFSLSSQGQILNARDALLRDLAEVYSPAVLSRLDAVLQGSLNLPGSGTATWPTQRLPTSSRPDDSAGPAPSWSAASSSQPPSASAAPPTVVTIPATQQGATAVLIALLALICGALVAALAGMLIMSRNNNGSVSSPPAQSQSSSPTSTAPVEAERSPSPTPTPTPATNTVDQWQACADYAGNDAPPPQAGETWWPVVGPREALADSRQHCRGDAFINSTGNVQIASFRDRDTATAFAEQLTRDNSHPYSFWVGDSTTR